MILCRNLSFAALEKPSNMHLLQSITPKPILVGKHTLVKVNLTDDNPNLDPLNPGPYIDDVCEGFEKTGIGGYLEKRKMYEVSDLFKGNNYRNRHLGIDIWQAAETPIYMPISGTIHSFNDNNTKGDYGPTIITQHQQNGQIFHLLFGHLSRKSLQDIQTGQALEAGQRLAWIGSEHENGQWPPHLHFQIIIDLQGKLGDYPGVAFEEELDFYQKNCPDPSSLIVFD